MAETSLTSDQVEVADAFEAMELYFERGWSDGLPVVPPTAEAVERFLAAAGLVPDRVLGVEATKGAVITAERRRSTPSWPDAGRSTCRLSRRRWRR